MSDDRPSKMKETKLAGEQVNTIFAQEVSNEHPLSCANAPVLRSRVDINGRKNTNLQVRHGMHLDVDTTRPFKVEGACNLKRVLGPDNSCCGFYSAKQIRIRERRLRLVSVEHIETAECFMLDDELTQHAIDAGCIREQWHNGSTCRISFSLLQ